MSGNCSGRFSKLFCLLLSIIIGFSFAFVLADTYDVYAAGSVSAEISWQYEDSGGLVVKVKDYPDGTVLNITIEFNSNDVH